VFEETFNVAVFNVDVTVWFVTFNVAIVALVYKMYVSSGRRRRR
jgi:hypothetical protein